MDHEASTSHDVLERMLIDESAEPTSLPFSLLQYITNRFSLDHEIGSGGFGVVYKGIVGKGMVAVKKLSNTFCLQENKFHEEVKCLIKAKHKNIVRFLGYCADTQGKMEKYEGKLVMADQRNWLLCFEYVCNGSLDTYITDATCGLDWRERYQIIRGICVGLLFLHEMRILHLDLKPANILLDRHMVPKIADFGLSRCLGEDQSRAITENLLGTLGYMDPEYLRSRQFTFASDIYSLGVIIREILTGVKVYLEAEDVVRSWMNRLGAIEGDMQLEQVRVCTEIALECMNSDPKKRPVARHIIDMLDSTAIADYSDETSINGSSVELQVRLPRDQFGERMGKLAVESLQKVDVEENSEMLELLHFQEGQQKIGQLSLWGVQNTKGNVTRHGASNSSSMYTGLNELKYLDIFKMKAPRNFGCRLVREIPYSLCGAAAVSGCRLVREIPYSLKKGAAAAVSDGGAAAAAAGFTVVMKFGGSSVASAERMREVADIILSFPEEAPVVVLSAMGKTTNNLFLAGEKAVSCGALKASEIDELKVIKELHLRTIDELGLDSSIVSDFLDELEQLLKGVATMKELTLMTRDYLVSFGQCMSTRIFAAYLNKLGKKARQYDAFDLGFITTDDFTNADILEATYPAVAKRLQGDWIDDPAIPIVTGFLGKGCKSCEVTTLGRGGSDLTATTIGKALGLREIQVWKDVDVLTCDPNIYPNAVPVPYLTFDEATEIAYFGEQILHPKSMRPAREGDIPVRVKNSYNRHAPGTVITRCRDMSKSILTTIVFKSNITMLDIASTRMLGRYGFLAKVFSIFEDSGISVDSMATSEASISLTLDPSKLWRRELIQQELDHVVDELEKIAVVHLLQHRSIISLIGNIRRSSLILEKAFNILRRNGVNVQMISQGASKVNISLVVHDSEVEHCAQVLHSAFFEKGFLAEVEEADLA